MGPCHHAQCQTCMIKSRCFQVPKSTLFTIHQTFAHVVDDFESLTYSITWSPYIYRACTFWRLVSLFSKWYLWMSLLSVCDREEDWRNEPKITDIHGVQEICSCPVLVVFRFILVSYLASIALLSYEHYVQTFSTPALLHLTFSLEEEELQTNLRPKGIVLDRDMLLVSSNSRLDYVKRVPYCYRSVGPCQHLYRLFWMLHFHLPACRRDLSR